MRVYDFINLSNVKHLLEIGFNDSWDSGEFKDRIDIINILLKNNLTIHYDIAKELKRKKQDTIARFLKKTIEQNYIKIKSVDMKFNIPALKKDMQSRTSLLMAKTFKK